MKLGKLLSCVIYRDGGSLEAVWTTHSGERYIVTLLIGDWDHPLDTKYYYLFNCMLESIFPHRRIDRGTPEHRHMLQLIGDWLA